MKRKLCFPSSFLLLSHNMTMIVDCRELREWEPPVEHNEKANIPKASWPSMKKSRRTREEENEKKTKRGRSSKWKNVCRTNSNTLRLLLLIGTWTPSYFSVILVSFVFLIPSTARYESLVSFGWLVGLVCCWLCFDVLKNHKTRKKTRKLLKMRGMNIPSHLSFDC